MDDTAKQPKKKQKRKPTVRMIKTAEIMVENGGNASQAMLKAGYSAALASNPQKLTRSETFQALMDKVGVTDDRLAEVLNDGLRASKTVIIGSGEDAFADQVDDHAVRHKFLETGLRLKGLGRSEAAGVNIQFNNIVSEQRQRYQV